MSAILFKKKEKTIKLWNELDKRGIFILNKILTGSFRVGASQLITLEALSKTLGIPRDILSLRLMGNWTPTAAFFESLKAAPDLASNSELNPYPFFLASPAQEPLEDLGDPNEWFAEWKWDGVRAQCIHRGGNSALWSRGNELITVQFPEIVETANKFDNGTVLDGEILAYQGQRPLPFSELQKRLGRKKVSRA